LVFTGEIWRPWRGRPGLELENICSRSWNYLSFDVFIDPVAPAKVSNQVVQRDPTGGSQTLQSIQLGIGKVRVSCIWIDKMTRVTIHSAYNPY
jgi:hypothetical protein